MANNGISLIRNLGAGVTPIVVGLILTGGTVAIPIIPAEFTVFLGWAMIAVGIVDLFNIGK